MFFALSKIVALSLKPLIWAVIACVTSFLLRSRKPAGSKWCAGLAVLIVVIFSNPLLLKVAQRVWEIPAVAPAQLNRSYDIGIVLGGYSNSFRSSSDQLVLGSEPNRLTEAVRLYKTGRMKAIVLTGGTGAFFGKGISEAPLTEKFLLDLGIPSTDIIVEADSRNTSENAIFTARLMNAEQKTRTSLLITSAFHMRRALGCFEKAGIPVSPYSTDTRGEDEIYKNFRDFLPDSWTLWQWEFLLREWVGTIAYRITGRI